VYFLSALLDTRLGHFHAALECFELLPTYVADLEKSDGADKRCRLFV
jgi:hypothetical protein